MTATDRPGAKELAPGLIVGCIWHLRDLLDMKPDAIAALDTLPPRIWEEGFRGRILYYPIEKYGVLPSGMLERLVEEIVSSVKDGKRVAIYSREDCGRVSYVAACALFQLGVQEPIPFLKKEYSPAVPEDPTQDMEIQAFCMRHIAKTYWHCTHMTTHIQIRDISDFQADQDVMRTFREIDESLGDKARIMLRFSGMLPSVRIMVEAPTEALCQQSLDRFVGVIQEKGHYVGRVNW